MAEAFTWGSGGNKLTANDRRRRLAEALLKSGSDTSPVGHWTQGLARVAQALVGGWDMNQADKSDAAGIAALATEPALNPSIPSAAPAASAAPSMAGGGETRAMAMPAVAPDLKDGIAQTASALGISPIDLATAISYETGGTFDPTKAGPRTQWGQHRGLIQFGEPQAREHGVDWSNPVASQLGPNGAVASYLKAAGVKPGMGMMDIYSAINAGGVGRYGASDANNGGAPGTVSDKVNNQMAGHRAKAMALFGDPNAPAPGASPVAMESGEPGFFLPPGAQPDAALPVMQPNGVLPNFDPATGGWLGPGTPRQAPNPGDPLPGGPPPAMSGQTFNQIASALDAPPLQPVFQSEGIGQPWMGTAIPPQPPAGPVRVSAPLPPSRPTDLAMPQADLPAPGAVSTIGQFAPPPQEDLSNAPGAGGREGIVRALMAQQGQMAPPASAPVQQVAQALAGGQTATAAAPTVSPAVQNVAAAAAPQAAPVAPGGDRLASAMRVLNSPYAQPGQRAIAQMIVQQAYKDPAEVEMKRLQLEKARREAEGAPLDVEGRRLDVEMKKKNLGKADAPTVQRIKQPDGSEVAVQWDQSKGTWVPLVAPEGGNAVKAPTKLTEQQSKDLTYFNRGIQALEAFEKDSDSYANGLERGASQLPGGNYLNSEQFQKARQSGRNFLASILRKDSGAAITDNEEKIYGDVFLPQPGDKPGMLAQKREARRQAIEAIKGGLGTAEVLARGSEILKAPVPQPPAPPTAPAPPVASDRSALEAEARRRGLIK